MEERDFISLNVIPPLHKGRSFVCYRDVNKAIEKHRELYGLRLALKRAVKLENYCLTVEQMKDLNLRLKYGELDYHCFAATGRPGRPGNDERCPQLIRLKLSADAQSLIVYESHNHNIMPFNEGIQKNQPPLKQQMDFFASLPNDRSFFKGDITLTPINPIQKNPVLILPKPVPGGEAQSTAPPALTLAKNFFINNNSFGRLTPVPEINSITITPTNPVRIFPQAGGDNSLNEGDSHEKITMRIKKSQVVPNEMVVVGSLRDTEEQLKSKGHEVVPHLIAIQPEDESLQPVNTLPKETLPKPLSQNMDIFKRESSPNIPTAEVVPKLATNVTPKTGNPPKVVSNNMKTFSQNPSPKFNAPGLNVGSVVKSGGSNKPPGVGLVRKTPSPSSGNPAFRHPLSQSQKEALRLKAKTAALSSVAHSTIATSTSNIATKPTVLKQSPNMKQIIIKKPSPIGDVKPRPALPVKPPNLTGKVSPNTVPSGFNKSQNATNRAPIGPIKPPVGGVMKPVFKSSASNVVKPLANKTNEGTKPLANKTNEGAVRKVVARQPIQNPKVSNSKSGLQNSGKPISNGPPLGDRIKPRIGDKNISNVNVKPMRNIDSSVVNGNSNGGNRLMNVPKKLKRKPGRPPESYSSTTSLTGSLDTELGYYEKQNLAHGVLLQLLRVTSQLPMVEFSHALDTLEVVTDAFKLGQRVSLTIKHDEDDLLNGGDRAETLIDRYLKNAALVSSTTVDDNQQPMIETQFDGQFDADELLKRLSTYSSVIPSSSERREEEEQRHVERMEVDVRANGDDDDEESRRGQKRVFCSESFMSFVGRAKRAKHQ